MFLYLAVHAEPKSKLSGDSRPAALSTLLKLRKSPAVEDHHKKLRQDEILDPSKFPTCCFGQCPCTTEALAIKDHHKKLRQDEILDPSKFPTCCFGQCPCTTEALAIKDDHKKLH